MAEPEEARAVILVVDDEPVIRMCVADELEANGFEVIEAESADEALDAMEERHDVRAIFTDINMPGRKDGLELARAVQKRWPDVRLIITSGRLNPTKADLPSGGRFVPKPYQPEMVADLLRRLLP